MKKLSVVAVIAIALAVTSAALAAVYLYKVDVEASATLVEGTEGLELYANEAATLPAPGLGFGQVAIGGEKTMTVYVKNVGIEALQRLWADCSGIPWVDVECDGEGTCRASIASCYSYEYLSLEPGQVAPLPITLRVRDEAPGGTITFTVTVRGSPAE